MAIFNNKNKFDKSNISLNKLGTIKYYEKIKQKKLNYIDYGITYTNKEIFKVLKDVVMPFTAGINLIEVIINSDK